MKYLNNLDLQKCEIQNFVVHNLAAAPSSPRAGQHYYNTDDNTEYVYNGTAWVSVVSQGHTFGDEFTVEGNKVTIKHATTDVYGIVEFASDSDASTGTATDKVVNPKQVKDTVDAAKEEIKSQLTDEYVPITKEGPNGTSLVWQDPTGSMLKFTRTEDGTTSGVCVNDGEKDINAQIYVKNQTGDQSVRLNANLEGIYYTKNKADAGEHEANEEIATKADVESAKTELQGEIDSIVGSDLKKTDLKATAPITYDADTTTISATFDEELTDDSNNFVSSGTVKKAIDALATKEELALKADQTAVDEINGKIPAEASAENQLADKAFVNDSVRKSSAHFRGNFETYELVPETEDGYAADIDDNKKPLYNDYIVVVHDENHEGHTWEYRYTGDWDTNGKEGWKAIYEISSSPLTVAQLAALDSGITKEKVGQIDTNTAAIAEKLGKTDLKATAPLAYDSDTTTLSATLDTTPTAESGNLVSSGAVQKAIEDAKTAVKEEVATDVESKLDKNADIEPGTHTKITYDAKGLVTAGEDLTADDIPTLTIDKVTDLQTTLDAKATKTDLDKYVEKEVSVEAGKARIFNDPTGGGMSFDKADGSRGGVFVNDGTDGLYAQLMAKESEEGTHIRLNVNLDGIYYTKGTGTANEHTADDEIATKKDVKDAASAVVVPKNISDLTDDTDTTPVKRATADKDGNAIDETYIKVSEKGVASGVATLGEDGKVPSTQLPSFVDDVIELKSVTDTAPETCAEGDIYFNTTDNKLYTATGENTWGDVGVDPESGKIYVTQDTNESYRWGGTTLVQIGADKLLGYNGQIVGDDTTTKFTINHALGTRNVVVELYEAALPYEKVYANIMHTDENNIDVIFAVAPATDTNYNVVICAVG